MYELFANPHDRQAIFFIVRFEIAKITTKSKGLFFNHRMQQSAIANKRRFYLRNSCRLRSFRSIYNRIRYTTNFKARSTNTQKTVLKLDLHLCVPVLSLTACAHQ